MCSKVIYKGKVFEVLHVYKSGYMEIKRLNSILYDIELVNSSEVEYITKMV